MEGQRRRFDANLHYTYPDNDCKRSGSFVKKEQNYAATTDLFSASHLKSKARVPNATAAAAAAAAAAASGCRIRFNGKPAGPKSRLIPSKRNAKNSSGFQLSSSKFHQSTTDSSDVNGISDCAAALRASSKHSQPSHLTAASVTGSAKVRKSSSAIPTAGESDTRRDAVEDLAVERAERDRQIVLAVAKADLECVDKDQNMQRQDLHFLGVANAFDAVKRVHREALDAYKTVHEAIARVRQEERDAEILCTSAQAMWETCKAAVANTAGREALESDLHQANERLIDTEKLLADAEAQLNEFTQTYESYLPVEDQGSDVGGLFRVATVGEERGDSSTRAGLDAGAVSQDSGNNDSLDMDSHNINGCLANTTGIDAAASTVSQNGTVLDTAAGIQPGGSAEIGSRSSYDYVFFGFTTPDAASETGVEDDNTAAFATSGVIDESSRVTTPPKEDCDKVRGVHDSLRVARDKALKSVNLALEERETARKAVVDCSRQPGEDNGYAERSSTSVADAEESLAKATAHRQRCYDQVKVAAEAAAPAHAQFLRAEMHVKQSARIQSNMLWSVKREWHKRQTAIAVANLAHCNLYVAKRALETNHSDPDSVRFTKHALFKALAEDNYLRAIEHTNGNESIKRENNTVKTRVKACAGDGSGARGASGSRVKERKAVRRLGSPCSGADGVSAAVSATLQGKTENLTKKQK